MIVRELLVKLGVKAQTGPLDKAINKFGGLKTAIIGISGLVAGAGAGLFALASSAAAAGDRAAKMSQALGLSAEALQELGFAAQIGGASTAELETGLRTLSRTVFEASQGSAEYAENFERLGIVVNNVDGSIKASDVILGEIADKFRTMPDGIEKTALAQEFFGRAGAKLIPLLKEGSDGIDALRQEARDLGGVLSGKALKDSEEFQDAMLRLNTSFLGVKNIVGAALIPIFIDLAGTFTEFTKGFLSNAKRVIQVMIDMRFFALGVAAGFVIMQAPAIISGFMRVGRAIKFMALNLRLMGNAALAAQLKLLLIPVAIGLMADDFIAFSQGRKSVIGLMIIGIKAFGKAFEESFKTTFLSDLLQTSRDLIALAKSLKSGGVAEAAGTFASSAKGAAKSGLMLPINALSSLILKTLPEKQKQQLINFHLTANGIGTPEELGTQVKQSLRSLTPAQ